MDITRTQTKRIVIQGGYGAFHELAARYYFEEEDIEIVPGNTFSDLFKTLHEQKADYAIMAIENMVAGGILPNYKLMKESGQKIVGEIYMRIQQNLVALPGQKIEDIKEVFSHPMAILQCQDFFEKYPRIKLVDSIDTALSARDISQNQWKGIGAISSLQAAERYHLEVIAKGIESNKMNYTRFLILTDKSEENCESCKNKASMSFALAHKIGSLAKILSLFSFHEINLSKIQSLPIIGKDWEYQFYVDVEFDNYQAYKHSLEAIKPFTSGLEILGEYKKGRVVI